VIQLEDNALHVYEHNIILVLRTAELHHFSLFNYSYITTVFNICVW